jgi:hypothetical protein
MKLVTKNYKLSKGLRSYLIYLLDDNDNSLECYDVTGEEDRLNKENEISREIQITEYKLFTIDIGILP